MLFKYLQLGWHQEIPKPFSPVRLVVNPLSTQFQPVPQSADTFQPASNWFQPAGKIQNTNNNFNSQNSLSKVLKPSRPISGGNGATFPPFILGKGAGIAALHSTQNTSKHIF